MAWLSVRPGDVSARGGDPKVCRISRHHPLAVDSREVPAKIEMDPAAAGSLSVRSNWHRRIVSVALSALLLIVGCSQKPHAVVAPSRSSSPTAPQLTSGINPVIQTIPPTTNPEPYHDTTDDEIWPCSLIPLSLRALLGAHVKSNYLPPVPYDPSRTLLECESINAAETGLITIDLGADGRLALNQPDSNVHPITLPGITESTYESDESIGKLEDAVVTVVTSDDSTVYQGDVACECSVDQARQRAEGMAEYAFPIELRNQGAPSAGQDEASFP